MFRAARLEDNKPGGVNNAIPSTYGDIQGLCRKLSHTFITDDLWKSSMIGYSTKLRRHEGFHMII